MKLRDMDKVGHLIYEVKSDSTDEVYEVRQVEEGNMNCSCIGYSMSKGRPKRCKHIRRYKLIKMLEAFHKQEDISDVEYIALGIEDMFKKEV